MKGKVLDPNTLNWVTIPELVELAVNDPHYDQFGNLGPDRWAVSKYPIHCRYSIWRYSFPKKCWERVASAERKLPGDGGHLQLPVAEAPIADGSVQAAREPSRRPVSVRVAAKPPLRRPAVPSVILRRAPAPIVLEEDAVRTLASSHPDVELVEGVLSHAVAPMERQSRQGQWFTPSEIKIAAGWNDAGRPGRAIRIVKTVPNSRPAEASSETAGLLASNKRGDGVRSGRPSAPSRRR